MGFTSIDFHHLRGQTGSGFDGHIDLNQIPIDGLMSPYDPQTLSPPADSEEEQNQENMAKNKQAMDVLNNAHLSQYINSATAGGTVGLGNEAQPQISDGPSCLSTAFNHQNYLHLDEEEVD